MENNQKDKWFKLEKVEVDFSGYLKRRYSVEKLEDLNKKIDKISPSEYTYYNEYLKMNANLVFYGSLNTSNGKINTQFNYLIQTDYERMNKDAEIKIYEQTFNGLQEAVTIRFTSGSIISKIVFGDIENAFIEFKEIVNKEIDKINELIANHNKEIDKKEKEQEKKDE